MRSEVGESQGLLKELERLAKTSEIDGFDIAMDTDGLPQEERELACLLEQILTNSQAVTEYELSKYRLTNDVLGIAHWDMVVADGDPISPDNEFFWSQEFRRLLGFSDTTDFPNVLSSWSDRLHPEDKDKVLEVFKAHITDTTGKTPYNLEYRLLIKSGEYRYFRAIGVTMRDAAGTPLKVAGALEDITVRVRQQEMLESVLDAMDSCVYVTDLETDEILFVNRKLIADYRMDERNKGDKCWQHLQLGQDARCPWCKKEELCKHPDEAITWEEENPISDRILYNIDRVIDWPDGRVVHMQQKIDITGTKRAQERLEQRDKLLKAVNNAADALLRAEPDTFEEVLSHCMGTMAKMIGADRVRVAKNHVEEGKLYRTQVFEWSENIWPVKDTPIAKHTSYEEKTPYIKDLLSRGESINILTRDIPSPDREWFSEQSILALMFLPVFIHDEFWGFVGFDKCHNEEVFTKDEEFIMHSGGLLIVNALLRNESMLNIQETSAQLEVALGDAKEANEAKSNFLAHMSHEIRTPLNAVVGLSELALSDDQLSDDAEDKLEKIHNSGMTILSIINDILDISKIESGKFELYSAKYDTPSLINDIITLNIVRIGEKPLEFKLQVDEDLPAHLYGDDLRVKQIFNNLLSNAFKYTDSGTVEWSISFERDEADIWLVSQVKDTGAGIKPEDLEKLFSEYAQVDKESNRKIEGTGLGLAITKRLVDMMDGTIKLESEYGKGSTATVRLRQSFVSDAVIGPAVAGSLMGLKYTLSKRASNTGLTRIDLSYASVLVVDDIATNLDVVKGMLKPYKVAVDCASSGKQAIEMIRKGEPRYSAVFMDHMMPGMDGIEATHIIREEIGTDYARRVPIIALTANAIVGNEEMFLNQGFQAFISKPIDTTKLDGVLRQWVRNKEVEREHFGADLLGAEVSDGSAAEGGGSKQLADGDLCASQEGSLLADITINGMDKGRALKRFGCDEQVLLEVLRSYAKNTLLLLDNLEEYLADNRLGEYGIAIHGIKGSSYSIFTNEVGKMAAALESAAKDGDIDTVRSHHDDFVKYARALIEDIKRALAVVDDKTKKPLAPAPDTDLLIELRNACKKFDIGLVNTAMAKLESFRYESGDELIEWLRDRISDMDFVEISVMDIPTVQSDKSK